MTTQRILEVIAKSPIAGKFNSLSDKDKNAITSDYRICADAVSLIVALWNDKRMTV